MKRILFLMLLIACVTNSMMAQDVMVIEKTDNTTVKYNVDDIKRVYFEKQQSGGVTFNPCTETGENSSTSISGLTSDGVTISVKVSGITYNALLRYSYTIYIGTEKSVSSSNYVYKRSGNLTSNLIISESFTGLSSNTTYYYVIYVTVTLLNNGRPYTSDIGWFTTLNSIITPTFNVTTYDVTDIGETTAKARAYFEVKNAVKDYVVGFFISTNSIPTSANSIKINPKNLSDTNYANALFLNVKDLSPGTKYYVRPYIYYDGSYHYGSITSFTTKSLSQTFNISNSGATDITKTSANVYAIFDIKNAAKAYRIGFFVSTNSTPTSANAIKDAYKNMTDANYSKMTSEKVDNLKPGTTYYVRPYILYDGTYHYGTITSFTTKSDTPELIVSDVLQFGDKGGEQTIVITASDAWSIKKSSGSSWLTIKPESGKAGTTTVTLSATENTSTDSRTSTLTIQCGGLSKSVKVTQAATGTVISLDTNTLEFTSESGKKTFNISSNSSWTVSSDKTWCSVSPTNGSGKGNVTVTVQVNTSTSARTATISIKSGSTTKTLTVKQNGATNPSSKDREFTIGNVKFKMISVEGGTFTMGGTSEQGSDADDSERPTHKVTLSSYYIGETEVTQALWQAVMGSNPSSQKGSNRPVEKVSWNDCQEFLKKLNAKTGQNFRLPTEAEWEYAARGGKKSKGYKYSGSNKIDNVAWYNYNSSYRTHDVATKQANELGIYDMSGNVWEWCSDWWLYNSYTSSAQTNPKGPTSGTSRVLRGGHFSHEATTCRNSARSYNLPTKGNECIGFRIVL